MEKQLPKKLRQQVSKAKLGKTTNSFGGYSKSEQKTKSHFHKVGGMDQSALAYTSGMDFPIHENYHDEDNDTEDHNQGKYEKFGNAHNIESIQNLGLSTLDLTENAHARESHMTLHEGEQQQYNG